MDKKIIIYFGNQTQKQSSVERVLQDMKLPYLIIEDKQLLDSVGYLMDLEGFDQHVDGSIPHYDSDLMILKNISDEEIIQFNQLLHALDIEMKRKAMLTQHNQHWKVSDLLQEIEKEHRYFQQAEEIQAILQGSKDLVIEEYTPSSWKEYEEAFYQAYACISKECSVEEMDQAYHNLTHAKQLLQRRKEVF